MSDTFAFQQFTLNQAGASQKVGEDSVLFGGWIDFQEASTVADLGTGTGILALIAAQRTSAQIIGLELDEVTSLLATRNAQQSPWNDRLTMLHGDVFADPIHRVDHVISNPPYFFSGNASTHVARGRARHLLDGPEAWINACDTWAHEKGLLSLVFPAANRFEWMAAALHAGWHRIRECRVVTLPNGPVVRIMATFSRVAGRKVRATKVQVRTASGAYHPNFLQFTKELYAE